MDIVQNPFSRQLRTALASKPFDIWSIPGSDPLAQDEDCSYDMETQSCAGESYAPMDEDEGDGDAGDRSDADWAMETQSADDHGPAADPNETFDAPVSIDSLDKRVRSMERQLEKQNPWNDDMARGMKTMQGGYQEVSMLREESAMLKKR
ncbi:uncharacterized protein N7506_000236 [Penicillium brevicompactum]|uniref:uncharacterized protein n=1 Tax=Penicillium brevicompactum TaxID=5074 RepID=UPI0025401410|nr:uncharacterized protein N7506_000236 [Penicillium brevicompactum]KAJ5346983.1 hypothetical protein N7506_000236 [Penicillium brevicompactum]